ncbi:hypothetical protein G647_09137 [Cladophialophora carrionii CBS 160.54]|uniref:Myb-like DNA-binding domain-containing protein n=1 Tax=Cladophialophora carrionii CBS 160.54 TaxID=1279043 RepID=V9CXE2_9EURO|nr:uncharacterized protein G647_09137 [Cladophialophora carrionii CBS 160.54]ETI19305.1 hypothetical protein G647_09137 [Cladophialophora carrionii CBS 160.54]
MASQRRTKNFANDPQTPMFLYNILKQLDLRSINWSEVADGLGISNGHAARMRYSRMKSQFEGLSSQPKPPKPKNENTSASKSAKSKAKDNKRRLIEEETERLGSGQPTIQSAMQQDHGHKRIKVEPQSYTNAWHNTGSTYTGYTSQPGANTYWCQPNTRSEPFPLAMPTGAPQSISSTPAIKQESEATKPCSTDVPSSAPAIKQEPGLAGKDSNMADSDVVEVERGAGKSLTQRSPTTAYNVPMAPSYPLTRTINAYFDRSHSPFLSTQPRPSMDSMTGYTTSQTFSHGAYPYVTHGNGNTTPSALSWIARPLGHKATAMSLEDDSHNMMLNPYATTYQDMLNMPLYRRSPSILPIPNPSTQQTVSPPTSDHAQRLGREQDTRIAPSATVTPAPEAQGLLDTTASVSTSTSPTSPESAAGPPEPRQDKTMGEQASTAANASLGKTGAEGVGNAASTTLVIDNTVVNIKTEVVEL